MLPEKQQKSHILIVDDEPISRSLLRGYLALEDYQVSEADDEASLMSVLAKQAVDLILLDVNLPGKNGFTIASQLRAKSDVGIILVTKRNADTDRIMGLEIGGDDYITKPYDPRELMARVRNVLRRLYVMKHVNADETREIRFLEWRLSLSKRCLITPEGEEVPLTKGEFKLLEAFVQKPNFIFTRSRLQSLIDPENKATSRSIDVLIGRLRQKLNDGPTNPKIIVTIHGAGYLFAVEPEH